MRLNNTLGQAARERRERGAAVSGFEDAAVRAVPCAVLPWAFARFPQRGVNDVGVSGINQHVRGAHVLVVRFRAAGENLLPVLAAVGGAIDPALRIGPVRMAGHSGENFVGIPRIDGEFWNLLAIAQAKMGPRLAGISGFVDAVPDREVRAVQPLAAADINNVGIRRRNGNRANGAGGLMVKDGLPCAAVIIRLPDASIADAYIEDVRLAGHAADGPRASATIRPDAAPLERAEQRRIKLRKWPGLGLGDSVASMLLPVMVGAALERDLRLGRRLGHLDLAFGLGLRSLL